MPLTAERTCRVCGCTDNDCIQCIKKTGKPCHWVEADLCSACVVVPQFKKGDRVKLTAEACELVEPNNKYNRRTILRGVVQCTPKPEGKTVGVLWDKRKTVDYVFKCFVEVAGD